MPFIPTAGLIYNPFTLLWPSMVYTGRGDWASELSSNGMKLSAFVHTKEDRQTDTYAFVSNP